MDNTPDAITRTAATIAPVCLATALQTTRPASSQMMELTVRVRNDATIILIICLVRGNG